jgi:hypothetical protein
VYIYTQQQRQALRRGRGAAKMLRRVRGGAAPLPKIN